MLIHKQELKEQITMTVPVNILYNININPK